MVEIREVGVGDDGSGGDDGGGVGGGSGGGDFGDFLKVAMSFWTGNVCMSVFEIT